MQKDRFCSECGAALPRRTDDSRCPACLLKLTFGDEPATIKQMTESVKKLIDNKKGFVIKDKVTKGFDLTATLTSLKTDDDNKPTSLEAKINISVLTVGTLTTGNLFNAKGNRKIKGINAKKMEEEVKGIVGDLMEDVMTKQAIPQMQKTPP